MVNRKKIIELTEDERRFISITPVEKLRDSFLAEIRCRRLVMTLFSFNAMRNYDQARELADERSIIGLADTEYWAPIRIDDGMIDAIAKREAIQLARDFADFREVRRTQP